LEEAAGEENILEWLINTRNDSSTSAICNLQALKLAPSLF
jgi:hypothetical protein